MNAAQVAEMRRQELEQLQQVIEGHSRACEITRRQVEGSQTIVSATRKLFAALAKTEREKKNTDLADCYIERGRAEVMVRVADCELQELRYAAMTDQLEDMKEQLAQMKKEENPAQLFVPRAGALLS